MLITIITFLIAWASIVGMDKARPASNMELLTGLLFTFSGTAFLVSILFLLAGIDICIC